MHIQITAMQDPKATKDEQLKLVDVISKPGVLVDGINTSFFTFDFIISYSLSQT
jgi:hypothetical protein